MKLIVFGPTGGTGLALCRLAVQRGHAVTAFARTPDKLPAELKSTLTVVQGNSNDAAAVTAALAGSYDAVLIALGSAGLMRRDTNVSVGTQNILAGIAAVGPRATPTRVIVCSSMGASESGPWIPSFIRWMLKHALADKDVQEAAVRAAPTAAIDFVIVRPTGLNDKAGRGTDALAAVASGPTPTSSISRTDVAAYMLDAAGDSESTRATWLGKAVGISWR